jgi:hypothetical protein
MNAEVLKMVTGWLSPSTTMIKLIRSPFHWNGIDCNKLFPKYLLIVFLNYFQNEINLSFFFNERCQAKDAVNYLVRLATSSTGSN